MKRSVEPELLDELPPADPRAIHSRHDLRRLNALMRHARHFHREIEKWRLQRPPRLLAEIGAGDGAFALRIARRLAPRWANVHLALVDRQDTVSAEFHGQFKNLGWSMAAARADVFVWLESPGTEPPDLILANLFLHHFKEPELKRLLGCIAASTQMFVACEPRRSPFNLVAARFVGLIGCNAVTRHDAVVSVRAGFANRELSAMWPDDLGHWNLHEKPAGLFSHLFSARRTEGT